MNNEDFRHWRRIVGFTLALFGQFYLTSPVQAQDDSFEFWIHGTNLSICNYLGSGGTIIIPSTHDGLLVTGVDNYAFKDRTSLTSVTIPAGITSIGDSAFNGCIGLTNVSMADSITNIGLSAFANCTNLTSVTLPDGLAAANERRMFGGCSRLTNIFAKPSNPNYSSSDGILFDKSGTTLIIYPQGKLGGFLIPGTVTNVGAHAFDGALNLTSITIPSSVATIGDYAFEGAANLTNIAIANGVGSIGNYAFESATSLARITIPDSVTNLGMSAFADCHLLTNVVISTGVTNIANYLFLQCYSLTNIIIPNSITSIGYESFYGCTNLTGIELPETLKDIGSLAFQGCIRITNCTIPVGVTNIPFSAFGNCEGLVNIEIPIGVTSIGDFAFSGCSSLTNFFVAPGNPVYTSINGVLFDKTAQTLLMFPSGREGSYAIPDSVTSIAPGAFNQCGKLTSITIPDSVVNLNNGTFQECSDLTAVVFGHGVTNIDDYTFQDCAKLAGVVIPENVTRIGTQAFYGCASLLSISIPAGVTFIGDGAFSACPSLTNIEVASGSLQFSSIDGVLFDSAKKTLIACPSGRSGSYRIPDGVTTIAPYAIYDASNLIQVVVPASVASLGYGVFDYCDRLRSVLFEGNPPISSGPSLGTYPTIYHTYGAGWRDTFLGLRTAVYDRACPDLAFQVADGFAVVIQYIGSGGTAIIPTTLGGFPVANIASLAPQFAPPTDVVIADGLTSIGNAAFEGCMLASIRIPSSVTNIGSWAFSQSSGLTNVILPPSISSISEGEFDSCPNLRDIAIPNSVTSIGDVAFRDCVQLTTIKIPDGVTNIGHYVFSGCSNLTSIEVGEDNPSFSSIEGVLFDKQGKVLIAFPGGITSYAIPDGVSRIADAAFAGCYNLTNVVISSSVTNIGDEAFANCEKLASVVIPDSVVELGYAAFQCCFSLKYVKLSAHLAAIEPGAFSWCTNLLSITIPEGITTIGDSMFAVCTNLTTVVIPKSVVRIGRDAFGGSPALQIYFQGDAPTVDGGQFHYLDSTTAYWRKGSSGWHSTFAGLPTALWPEITAQIQGKNLILTWPRGVLLESTNPVSGPWVTNRVQSPVTIAPDGPQKFYQLKLD